VLQYDYGDNMNRLILLFYKKNTINELCNQINYAIANKVKEFTPIKNQIKKVDSNVIYFHDYEKNRK
jgi:hypothetical protein